jgi:small subunit ribosomal protein S4
MAKNTQPVAKRCKALGISPTVMGYDKKTTRRNAKTQMRRKQSEYAQQMNEKQKVKFVYGVLEKQFRTYYENAVKAPGKTGEVLLTTLERRLDNVVYRLGIAPTRAAARQLVGHKHIVVDGQVVNIPSYIVKPGQVVGVREKNKTMAVIVNALANPRNAASPWLEWDEQKMAGTFVRVPERAEIPETIDEQAIVELYSR